MLLLGPIEASGVKMMEPVVETSTLSVICCSWVYKELLLHDSQAFARMHVPAGWRCRRR